MKPFFLLLILSPFLAFSQDDKIKVGLITCTGLSWMSSEAKEITTEKSNLSFSLLFQGEYLLTEKFVITGGVGFSSRVGGELKFSQGGNLWSESKLTIPNGDSLPNNVSLRYKVNYFEIPIGFKMQTLPIYKFKFFAHPEISLGTRLRVKGDIDGSNVESTKENIKRQIFFFALNWGLNLGAEYTLTENLGLQLGFRYQQSIIDVTDDSGKYFDGSKVDFKDKINNLGVRVGIIF